MAYPATIELFQTSKLNISLQVQNIYAEDELLLDTAVKINVTMPSQQVPLLRKFQSFHAVLVQQCNYRC